MDTLSSTAFFHRRRWLLWGLLTSAILSAIGFGVVTWLVRADLLRQLDFDFTVRLQDWVPLWLDPLLIWFGFFAKFQVLVPLLIVSLLLCRQWWLALSSLAWLFVAHVIELVGKSWLFQPPPPFMFYRHPTDFVFPELHVFDLSSYPSGHSMRAVFAVWTWLLVVWYFRPGQLHRRPIRLIVSMVLLGFVGVVTLSRVSLGEHWLSDVLGGGLLGVCMASLSSLIILVPRFLRAGKIERHHAQRRPAN